MLPSDQAAALLAFRNGVVFPAYYVLFVVARVCFITPMFAARVYRIIKDKRFPFYIQFLATACGAGIVIPSYLYLYERWPELHYPDITAVHQLISAFGK